MVGYLKNSFWLVGEKLLRLILSLFIGIALARYLGPQQFGYIGYFLALFFILKAFSSLGLEQVVVKELSRSELSPLPLYSTYRTLKLVAGGLAFAGFCWYAIETSLEYALFAVPLMSVLMLYGIDFHELYAQSKGNSRRVVKLSLVGLCISSVIKITLIFLDAPLEYFLYSMALDFYLIVAGFWLARDRSLGQPKRRLSLVHSKRLLESSWPLLLSSVSVILYMKIDTVMLFNLKGAHEAGIYSVAVRLSEVLYFIPSMLLIGLFPLLIRKYDLDQQEYSRIVQGIVGVMLCAALVFVVGVLTLGEFFLVLLFGEDYRPASTILVIHVLAAIPVFTGVVFRKMAIIENLQRVTLYTTTAGCVLNVVLNFLWIPQHGGEGAAYATLASRLLSSVFLYGCFKGSRHYVMYFIRAWRPTCWFSGLNILKGL